jgi:cytochrome b pre-mRNA-processing protein 3
LILDIPRVRSAAKIIGRSLYETAVRQARTTALYTEMGAPDTVEGRFELLTLHVILLISRLKEDSAALTEIRQSVFDTYIGDLDGALREMGVGDLSVGKRMKALGAAFYGRADSFERALAKLPSTVDLESLLSRTVLAEGHVKNSAAMTDYVLHCHMTLGATETPRFLEGRATWPAP